MTGTMRVLVADDEPGMRSGVVRALRGFSVALPGVGSTFTVVLKSAAPATGQGTGTAAPPVWPADEGKA